MKKTIKIIAGCVAALLIVGVIGIAGSFLGNPVSYLLAYLSGKEYLKDNYADTDYEIERVSYSFKFGDYLVYATSPTNIDGDFTITLDYKGKVESDDYTYRVVERSNTEWRLRDEYKQVAEEGFSNQLTYDWYSMLLWEEDEEYELHEEAIARKALELNKAYDIKAFAQKQGHIEIWGKVDEPTAETLAQTLLEVKAIADANGVPFYSVGISLYEKDSNVSSVDVRQFLYADIYEEGLMDRVEREIAETQAYYEGMFEEKQEELDAQKNPS